MKHSWLLLAGTIFSSVVTAQQSTSISGIVLNKNTQQVVQGATISLQPSNKAVLVDSTGRFTLKNIIPGTYTVTIKALGYKTETKYNVILNVGNETSFTVELEPEVANLQNVTVRSSRRTAKAATLETPLSVQRLTTEEIKANPGGNFDISRVIQSLPGVGGTAGSTGAFRNDIIIRGGAPNENVFYLDGIEIPNIHHFA
ncbi:MAG TPA: TonB-dependent receptor, partial [Chitinophagaceae bacterium]|nr:TonB-dependent receptor [Chitinophagaceae bacterium]